MPITSRGLRLLLTLTFLAAAAWCPAQDKEKRTTPTVLREFGLAYQARDWSRAIELGHELVELAPGNGTHQYNLACVYALNGDTNAAAEWLGESTRNGFSQVWLIETDGDLKDVRASPAYLAALQNAKENRAKVHASLKKKFDHLPPKVILPFGHATDKAAPLIIALHGYGDRAGGSPTLWRNVAAQAGAILVAPQAVHPAAPGGYSWLAAGSAHGDDADYLVQLTLEFVRSRFKIDETRIVLAGFSQGGFAAYWVGARHPETFCGVIPMGCGYIRALDAPPKPPAENPPRFYFMVGELDRAADACRVAAADFAAAGYPTKLRVYPGVGHMFPKDRDAELRKALQYALGE
ncbi:MAG: dienelactone hydrolase family protein [Planctomycetes bacterium]|nr:dienelactone hydrolase family protein [Planctomycetota bacterium]